MRMGNTPEERIAGAVMATLRHIRTLHGPQNVMSHVDHRDFIDDLKPFIDRELLAAKLEALEIPLAKREQEKRRILLEMGKLAEKYPE